jgi:hypothetical protein
MSKQSKYTKSARGQDCQIRIPGVCNHDPETTVFAHLPGGGMGAKQSDIHGAYACSDCHFWLDGGYTSSQLDQPQYTRNDKQLAHFEGMFRTQTLMIENGVLVI